MNYDWSGAVSGLNDYVDRLRTRHQLGLDNALRRWAGGELPPPRSRPPGDFVPQLQTGDTGISQQPPTPMPPQDIGGILRGTLGNAGAGIIDAFANGDFNGAAPQAAPETHWLSAVRPQVPQPQQFQVFQSPARRMAMTVPNLLTRYMG